MPCRSGRSCASASRPTCSTACADKHLRLLWHESVEESQDEATLVAALAELFRLENHGLRRVERLPENLGLIELTVIPPAASAGDAIAAAMRLVEHTQGLILDARAARGGSPDGVAFLCSFLFADGDVHLGDIVEGPAGPARQYWTSAYLPAPRYLERPVYVLTSASTFSGGEELALQPPGAAPGHRRRRGHPRRRPPVGGGLADRAGRAAAADRPHRQPRDRRQLGGRRRTAGRSGPRSRRARRRPPRRTRGDRRLTREPPRAAVELIPRPAAAAGARIGSSLGFPRSARKTIRTIPPMTGSG